MKKLILVSLLLSFGSFAQDARATFLKKQTLELDSGLSLQQVVKIMGQPDKVDQSTCGGNAHPWTCRIYDYTYNLGYNYGQNLFVSVVTVYFRKSGSGWEVNNWNTSSF